MLHSLGTHRLIQAQIQESLVQAAALKPLKTTHAQRESGESYMQISNTWKRVVNFYTSFSPLDFGLAVMVPIQGGDGVGN